MCKYNNCLLNLHSLVLPENRVKMTLTMQGDWIWYQRYMLCPVDDPPHTGIVFLPL